MIKKNECLVAIWIASTSTSPVINKIMGYATSGLKVKMEKTIIAYHGGLEHR